MDKTESSEQYIHYFTAAQSKEGKNVFWVSVPHIPGLAKLKRTSLIKKYEF